MIRVIISHDVDHIRSIEHYTDLIIMKLWARTFLEFFSGKIGLKLFIRRLLLGFTKEWNHINEVADFDTRHNVQPTFFFGMANCLGMNYRPEDAVPYIRLLQDKNIDVGVHGCTYDDLEKIQTERDRFFQVSGMKNFGVRMHYIRMNNMTAKYLASAGYLFDSSKFDKKKGYLIKEPYLVDGMWEFPLTIMDGYLPGDFAGAKRETLRILDEAEKSSAEYVTILFHDYQYCPAYEDERKWYEWLIEYLDNSDEFTFISYADAIRELKFVRGIQARNISNG